MRYNMFNLSRWVISGIILFFLFMLMPINYLVADELTTIPMYPDPPFHGTIFIDPDIITPSDPTTFVNTVYTGQGPRTMFDRRVNNWITVNAYLFNTSFSDGLSAEIQVNPEFGSSEAALLEAQKYGTVIGRLPTALRTDVQTVWIHKGLQPFGGGNNNLLIHTEQGDLYEADGILEETFVHEAAHTSLDAAHASASGWIAAQNADGTFISTYARDNPNREDIAESFLPYLAVRHRSDRISSELANTILQTIPNRITYFDNQSFNMFPITTGPTPTNTPMPTSTPMPTNTSTSTSTPIPTNTSTSTSTPMPTSTTAPTSTPISTNTPTSTSTPIPTSTAMPINSATPISTMHRVWLPLVLR